jgi:hypothetical protein
MKKLQIVALAFGALLLAGTASANDNTGGKKGLGVAAGIGGAAGFAFNYGMSNSNLEVLLGVNSIGPKDGDRVTDVGLGVAYHFHALRAKEASWTIGGRVNVGINSGGSDATQFGLDIPTRVYWFPNEHFSLHWETGIAVILEGDKGGAGGLDGTGVGEGNRISIGAIAGMGATFWW